MLIEMRNRLLSYGVLTAILWLMTTTEPSLRAQDTSAADSGDSRKSLAVTYPERTTVEVQFRGTRRLPLARGKATVRGRRGAAEIDIRIERMKPALFGGDYNTYVLWTVSPEGVVVNTGEFILRGRKSRLKTSTPLSTFGMFVTAEPHFLVRQPSAFVVLQNVSASLLAGKSLNTSMVSYRGFEGKYESERETLADAPESQGEYRVERQQAMTAMSLAEKAQALRYAPQELAKAQEAVNRMLEAFGRGVKERDLALVARAAIRAAVEAQTRAEERAEQAARDAQTREIADLRVAKAEAEAAQAKAQQEAAAAQRERMQALEAKAEAQEAARLAQIEQQQAQQMMRRAEMQTERLSRLKEEAERYAAAARSRLRNALNQVVETRESARGVVVNLPDILFSSDFQLSIEGHTDSTGSTAVNQRLSERRAHTIRDYLERAGVAPEKMITIRPKAREVLSRLAGILLVMPDFQLSIEGHTDSTGSTAVNQRLSERRTHTIRDYLERAGVAPEKMITIGLGESQPMADNSWQPHPRRTQQESPRRNRYRRNRQLVPLADLEAA